MNVFAQNLTELILRSGTMQKDIAKKVGVGRGTISDYARGKSEPSIRIIKKLCQVLDCTYEDLLGEYYEE